MRSSLFHESVQVLKPSWRRVGWSTNAEFGWSCCRRQNLQSASHLLKSRSNTGIVQSVVRFDIILTDAMLINLCPTSKTTLTHLHPIPDVALKLWSACSCFWVNALEMPHAISQKWIVNAVNCKLLEATNEPNRSTWGTHDKGYPLTLSLASAWYGRNSLVAYWKRISLLI